MDEGTLVMCGLSPPQVLAAVRFAMDSEVLPAKPVRDYEGGAVSRKVVGIVLSYIDYINRVVWQKESVLERAGGLT
jgi:UDP-N-acetylglucosamine 2-epimerase (non-hydrolysing)